MARIFRSPFAGPGEKSRGVWRAFAEGMCGGVLMLLTHSITGELSGPPSDEALLFLGIAVLALLVVRRRFPKVSLLGTAALMGLLPAAGLPAAVTAYSTAKQLVVPRHRALVLFAATGIVTLTATFSPLVRGETYGYGLALGVVLAATTLIVPGLVGTSGGQQERLLRALGERAAAAEEAQRLTDSESRTHERSRIAAEMHDLVGHRLSLISLHSGGLEMALQKESPELRDEAALVRRATGDAMRELREVLGVLGPLGRDTGTGALTDATGTRSDIEALAEESRRVGIPVDLLWDGPDLDVRSAQVRRAVHRVVRECLTNVHRYAAGARVTVSVTHTDSRVDVLVRNGVPPVRPEVATGLGSGRGLIGLRERVALLGGSLEAKPTGVGGFAVSAQIPSEPDPGAALADAGGPPGEVPTEPHEGRSLARVQSRVVGAITGLLGLAGIGVMMLFGLVLVDQGSSNSSQSHYAESEEPRIGMSRGEVMTAIAYDSVAVRAAATGREPDRPTGATSCVYPSDSSDDFVPASEVHGPGGTGTGTGAETGEVAAQPSSEDGPGQLRVTRYCFRGETLTAIDHFTVPTVSQKPPWETP